MLNCEKCDLISYFITVCVDKFHGIPLLLHITNVLLTSILIL